MTTFTRGSNLIPIENDFELRGCIQHALNVLEVQEFRHVSVHNALKRSLDYLDEKENK